MEKLGIGITAESSQEQQEPQAVKEEATTLLPPEPPEPELPEGPPILKQSETIAEDISLPVDNNIDSTTTIPSRFNFQGDIVHEPVIKTAPLQSSQLKSTDFMAEAQAIKEDEESKTENELRQEHHFIQSVHNVMKYKMPDEYEYMTDDEVMDAGLDYIGQINYNIPSAIAATLDYDEADDLTLSSLAYMMSAYEDKKISVQGTMRLGYGLITDPSTYIGVGTFGFGGAAKVGGQMTAKKALNNYILSRMGLTSAESALYSGGGTALYQNLEQKTGAREGYDEGEIALATGLGAVFPKVLETGVKGAAKGISKVGDWAEGGMAQAAGGGTPTKYYHGTDAEFTEFDKVGNRITSMGYGHYFAPNKGTAEEYGKIIKEIDIDDTKFLDWNNLSDKEAKKIESRLIESIPDDMILGYASPKKKYFSKNNLDEADEFFNEQLEKTKDAYHDRAKPSYEKDGKGFYIQYVDPDNISIDKSDLKYIMQQYDQNIARDMGYKGAKDKNEIVIYDTNLVNESITSQGNTTVKDIPKPANTKVSVSENEDGIVLSKIQVDEGARNQGRAREYMKELINYSDETGKRIALSPSNDFGASKAKLVKFYKSLGFVPNTGKNKDFSTQESYIYRPRKASDEN